MLREFRVGTPQVIGASFEQRLREKFAIKSISLQFVATILSLHAKHIRIFAYEAEAYSHFSRRMREAENAL